MDAFCKRGSFDEVWKGDRNSYLLVNRSDGQNSPMMFVEIKRPADGAFWKVTSGGIYRSDYPETGDFGKEPLWRRSRDATPLGGAEPHHEPSLGQPPTANAGTAGTGSTDRNTSGQSGTRPLAEPRFEIYFARISAPDGIKRVIDGMAQAFKPKIAEAKRGVQSNETTQAFAGLANASGV